MRSAIQVASRKVKPVSAHTSSMPSRGGFPPGISIRVVVYDRSVKSPLGQVHLSATVENRIIGQGVEVQ